MPEVNLNTQQVLDDALEIVYNFYYIMLENILLQEKKRLGTELYEHNFDVSKIMTKLLIIQLVKVLSIEIKEFNQKRNPTQINIHLLL